MRTAAADARGRDGDGWDLPAHGLHQVIEPPALHFGAPVVLVSTTSPGGEPLLRPISACAPVGTRIWIGFEGPGQTRANLERTGDCVVNVPQADLSPALVAFQTAAAAGAATDGFEPTGLTPVPSEVVTAPRVRECYLQIECSVRDLHVSRCSGSAFAELEVERVHAVSDIVQGDSDRIDADAWRPLLYSFTRFLTTARLPDRPADQWEVRPGGGPAGR